MYQKITVIGNIGKDITYKVLESGLQIATFPVATSESYKNKAGEKITETEWFNVVMYRAIAENANKYLSKGDKIFLEGKIKTKSYEKDGQKVYRTELEATKMVMLGGVRKEEAKEPEQQHSGNLDEEDPLPF